jgi:hypothetical protein
VDGGFLNKSEFSRDDVVGMEWVIEEEGKNSPVKLPPPPPYPDKSKQKRRLFSR